MKMDIVIIGVGGQGTLLTSRILGALATLQGHDVKVSEVHGMSQRGGSVITYVRLGQDVASPIVDFGGADVVLAFEQLEALRALPYLKKDGILILNVQKIWPMPVITGATAYPEDVLEKLSAQTNCVALDALQLAQEAGEARAVNLVLLGVLCRRLAGDVAQWKRAIAACVPEKLLAVNERAFELGYGASAAH
ncbi:MAG: indolepyruvate oxidoreductase subunit beta [Clostridia bacterium]